VRLKAVTISALCILGACGSHGGSRNDAPVGKIHEAPRQVWLNMDEFPNVGAFCIGPNGMYTNTRQGGASLIVIPNDANCKEGGLLYEATTP